MKVIIRKCDRKRGIKLTHNGAVYYMKSRTASKRNNERERKRKKMTRPYTKLILANFMKPQVEGIKDVKLETNCGK